MCQKCDILNSDVNLLTEDQLLEHHFDLMMEISDLARQVAHSQTRIAMLTSRIEEVEAVVVPDDDEISEINETMN